VGRVKQLARTQIDDSDFIAEFDGRSWTALWKWKNGEEPPESLRGAAAYALAKQYEEEVSQELSEWKKNGWLIPFNGKAKAILPLMVVVQAAKGKVRPVLDYRALNVWCALKSCADGGRWGHHSR